MSIDNKELDELKAHLDEVEVEEEENIIVLNDADGNEIEFEFLDLVEYNEEEYAVLLPVEGDEEDTVVILKVEETEDEMGSYVSVDDDAVVDSVFEIFKEKFKDVFNFG